MDGCCWLPDGKLVLNIVYGRMWPGEFCWPCEGRAREGYLLGGDYIRFGRLMRIGAWR